MMDDTTAKLQDIVIPADDGEISRALAELEGKLEAWTTAVAEVHSALAGRAATEPAPQAESPAGPPAAAPDVHDEAVKSSHAPESPEPLQEPQEPPQPEQDLPFASTDSPDTDAVIASAPEAVETESPEDTGNPDDTGASAVPEEPPAADASEAEDPAAPKDMLGRRFPEIRTMADFARVKEEQEAEASTSDDDEALLNTLDPQAAAAIRVMRRVSPEKKTIRELIEQYEAMQSSNKSAPSTKKKSWWARG